jgi:16S rRNA (cytosine1402-N4)-methyltransferase
MSNYHTPVLVDEVLSGLAVDSGKTYLDATVGGGGHAEAIMQHGGIVIGLDQDDDALAETRRRLGDEILLLKGNFYYLEDLLRQHGVTQVDGVLFDLGVSSHQLDRPERGFGFDGLTLDMRMDQAAGSLTAAEFITQLREADLAVLIRDLGEEHYAHRYAKVIKDRLASGPIASASELRQLLWEASPDSAKRSHHHPATKVFQAIRMAINAELPSLSAALPQAANLLCLDGRLVAISFHSLEDRVVKRAMVELESLDPLTRNPVVASVEEVRRNPRSRSAKLRIARKC